MSLYQLDSDLNVLLKLVKDHRTKLDTKDSQIKVQLSKSGDRREQVSLQRRLARVDVFRKKLSGHFFFLNGMKGTTPHFDTITRTHAAIVKIGEAIAVL